MNTQPNITIRPYSRRVGKRKALLAFLANLQPSNASILARQLKSRS